MSIWLTFPKYCLAVRKDHNIFVRDESQPDGLGDLPVYEDLLDILSAEYSEVTAQVEWRGRTFVTRVFVSSNESDSSYALVDDQPFVSGVEHGSHGAVRERLAKWTRKTCGFGETVPFCSPMRLETEFVEPEIESWNDETGPTADAVRWLEVCDRARVVVMGGAGAGKSTLMRHLALREVHRSARDNSARVPIYIMLRDATEASDILTLARNAVESRLEGVAEPDEVFKHLLNSGRLLLLLDGLDEMAVPARNQLIDDVRQVAAAYPHLGVHITTRQWDYPWSFPGFLHIRIRPFGEYQIRDWFQRRFTKTDFDTAARLMKVLLGDDELTELAGNPLLLEMLAGVFSKTGSLPGRKADLFSRYLELILEDWDKQRGIRRTSDVLLKEDKLEAISAAALTAWREKRVSFTENEVEKWIEQSASTTQPESIRAVLRDCGLFTIVSSRGPQAIWQFRHSSFRDYLAAYYLVAQPESIWTAYSETGQNPESLSLWRHACGSTTDATSLLRHIRTTQALPSYERARWLTLALADGIRLTEEERHATVEFVGNELLLALSLIKISVVRHTEDRRWRIVLERGAEEIDSVFLDAITDILHTIIWGGWAGQRTRVLSQIKHSDNSVTESLDEILQENWIVWKHSDHNAGTSAIEGVGSPISQVDVTPARDRHQ